MFGGALADDAAQTPADSVLPTMLDQSFEEVVSGALADGLDEMPPFDALWLLMQSGQLDALRQPYIASLLGDYQLKTRPFDLMLWAYVIFAGDEEGIGLYCQRLAEQTGKAFQDADACLASVADVFLDRRGNKYLPDEVFTPGLLDLLYRARSDERAVLIGNFGEFSDLRLLQAAILGDDAVLAENSVVLGNTMPCSTDSARIASLDVLRPLCTADPQSAELPTIEELAPYRLLSAVVALCADTDRPQLCRRDLIALHQAGMCREPLHLAPMEGYYQSRLFRTCMEDYKP
ncbi:hypothetical protein [Paracoccus xiamenensis]|uniref:hypothetical protein n=1 Tax=Paracoccus xiamenensis TaxID=2714901 RepID=UPI00140920A8|nr:hypothetical protein [Paracoccus xiamenensis]NHF74538.1 hypothetical protein [Paracoccus xiamenensis]